MPRKHRVGYDFLAVPSGPELKNMCLNEGLTEEEAEKKAKKFHTYLDSARKAEARFWNKVRQYEQTDGLDPDTPEAKRNRYGDE